MRTVIRVLIFVGLAILSPRAVEACTVIQTDIKLSEEEVRRYYREFKGAIFVGKVLSLKDARLPSGSGFEPVTQVEVKVQALWIGEKTRKIIVYTGTGEGDCHMTFEVGRVYGFHLHLENGFLRSTFINTKNVENLKDREKWVSNIESILGPGETSPN